MNGRFLFKHFPFAVGLPRHSGRSKKFQIVLSLIDVAGSTFQLSVFSVIFLENRTKIEVSLKQFRDTHPTVVQK
jgi:hypothetical protein